VERSFRIGADVESANRAVLRRTEPAPLCGSVKANPLLSAQPLRGRSTFVPSSTRELLEREAFLHCLAVHYVGGQD
jgi:hypothetical protein